MRCPKVNIYDSKCNVENVQIYFSKENRETKPTREKKQVTKNYKILSSQSLD